MHIDKLEAGGTRAASAARRDKPGMKPLAFALSGLAVVFAMLLPTAIGRAMWTDELFSLVTAELPPREMIRQLSLYQPGYFDHPPLFFMLLRPLLMITDHPFLLRIPMMVIAGLAVGLTAALFARETGHRVAPFLLLPVMTLNPAVWDIAIFVRSYGLLMLLGCGSTWIALDLMRQEVHQPWRHVLGMGAMLGTALWLSYFSLVLCASIAAVAAVLICNRVIKRKAKLRQTLPLLAPCAVAGIVYIPWWPTVLRLLAAESSERRSVADAIAAVCQISVESLGSWSALALLAVALLLGARAKREHLAVALAFFLLPLCILAARSPESRALAPRYLIFGFPALFLVAGSLVLGGWQRLANRLSSLRFTHAHLPRTVAILVVGACLLSQYHGHSRLMAADAPDWWAVAGTLKQEYRQGEIVMTGGFLSGEAVTYHMETPEDVAFLHYVVEMDNFYLACRDPRTVWYINAAPLPEGFARIIRRYFPHRIEVPGNGNRFLPIMIAAKKPFHVPHLGASIEHEPEVLEYEQ